MMTDSDPLAGSALADVHGLPLCPGSSVLEFGPTLIIAPHSDDETLGCGGAIALLRRGGCPVRVVVMTDGTGSHPNSRRYPPGTLRSVREGESVDALAILGVESRDVSFMRLPDTAVPSAGEPNYDGAVDRLRQEIDRFDDGPATILLPWRRDPHGDHRAVWHIVQAAVSTVQPAPRLIEYPIWVWWLSEQGDPPESDEMDLWIVDITKVAIHKQRAIAVYRSQTTNLIDDDPEGFRLTPAMLAHFSHPWELYLEERR